MKIVGIIAEYNPFHNGHKYHLDQAKQITGADTVVAVISGPVTQRGEIALCDKWNRAKMAVDNGVDLVLELPFGFAVNSAEEFARGGISILNSLGCVTDLVFGCESNPETVISMARRSAENEELFQNAIRCGLEEGLSYPQSRGRAMMRFHCSHGQEPSLDQPNDILAVEYVRQLILQDSDMIPHGVKRRGSYHDIKVREIEASDTTFSSATAVRKAIREGRVKEAIRAVPPETMNVLKTLLWENESGEERLSLATAVRMDSMILSHLLYLGPEGIREIYGCSEGLEYRVWNMLPRAGSVEELLQLTTSGRYPKARVRRMLIHALVGLTKAKFDAIKSIANEGQLYVRVLGLNESGAKLLKQIKKSDGAPLICTNLNKELSEEEKRLVRGELRFTKNEIFDARILSLALDLRAAEVAAVSRGERLYDSSDFVKGPYIAHKCKKSHK